MLTYLCPCFLSYCCLDGICCRYRNGFVTITNKKNGADKVVVFESSGDFESSLEVLLRTDENGRGIEVVDAASASIVA